MKIKKINKSIDEIIKGAEYLGNGASKEAFLKNGIVYKVPRGRYVIEGNVLENYGVTFPDTIEEVDKFLEEINDIDCAIVWPLGQFAIELIVWEAIQQLRAEGLKINCFAEIKDYYFDKNGVIVIEQEMTNEPLWNDEDDELWSDMIDEIHTLEPIFEERFNITLRDIRDGNCGVSDGRLKLFDFGISTSTSLDDYGSYSQYNEYSC